MAGSLTEKQEAFVQAYIGLDNAAEAYRRAYDAGSMNANTVNKAAQELLDNPKIQEAIKAAGLLDKAKNSAPHLKGVAAAKIEQWPIDKLVPYAQNARSHPPSQIAQLAASIKTFGFNVPCLVDKDGNLVAGHGRVLGAKELGLKTVPVIQIKHLTDAQIKAYRIADNKIALNSGWLEDLLADELAELKELDFDLSVLGFEDRELQSLLLDEADLERAELTPEVPDTPVTVKGDVWVMGKHRLVCGDTTSADVLDRVGANELDCVFTSPPYAVGIDYGEYKDTIDNLRQMLPILAAEWMARVVPGGFGLVNFSDVASGNHIAKVDEPCEYPMAVEYWPVFRAAGWVLWTRRIWVKPHARVHSPWAIQSCRASSDWEHIWVWKKPGKAITARGDHSAFGVWDTSKDHGVDVGKEIHGAGMAVGLATRGLVTHSRAGSKVFEPFSGTGTTIIAGEMTGRSVRATELNEAYVDVAVLRWQNFAKQQAVLEGDGRTFTEIKEARHGSRPGTGKAKAGAEAEA